MTQTSLRAVTLKTVANYHHAAERAVAAYRLGGHRLIVAMRQGVDSAARRSAQRFAPRMVAVIQHVGQRVGSLAAKGLDAVSSRSSRVLELGSDGVRSQVERVAERVAKLAGGVDYPVVANGLQAAVRFSLPGAQVALALSERVAAGAARLETAAAGPRSTRAKAAAQRVRRGAAPGRSAGKVAVKAVGKVDAEVKTASRRAATSVGKAARRVSDAGDAAVKARKPAAKPNAQAIKAVKAVKAVKAARADLTTATKPARRALKKMARPLVDAAKDGVKTIAA